MLCRILVVTCSILMTAVQSESYSAKRTPRYSQQLSFEDLLYFDTDATLMWNFIEKYNILENKDNLSSNKTHLKCIEELNIDTALIGPYLVNLTLNNVTGFIYRTSFYGVRGTKLAYAEYLKENITNIIKDEEVYYSSIEKIRKKVGLDEDKEYICFKNSSCACIYLSNLKEYWDDRDELVEREKLVSDFLMFGSKIDPPIRVIVIILGIVLNSALLVTFVKQKSVRIESNICIFSLLINNFIILMVYTPLQYVHRYHHYNMYTEYSFHIFEITVISVNVFIVLIISAQRYFDVSRALRPNVDGCKLSPKTRCCMYSSFIWIPSIAIAAVICSFDNNQVIHGLQTVLYFLVYLLLLAILVVLFNSLTARKLQRAMKQGQISLENETITSSTVVIAITGVYYLTFTLFLLFLPFDTHESENIRHYYFSVKRRVFSLIFHNLFSLYPSIIILALYKSNSTFRKYLRIYLFRCWIESGEEKYITMSSLKNDET